MLGSGEENIRESIEKRATRWVEAVRWSTTKQTNKSKVQNLSPHTEHSKERLCPSIPVIMSEDSTVDRLQTEASWGNSSGGSTPKAGFPADPVPNSGEPPVDQQWHYIKAQKSVPIYPAPTVNRNTHAGGVSYLFWAKWAPKQSSWTVFVFKYCNRKKRNCLSVVANYRSLQSLSS